MNLLLMLMLATTPATKAPPAAAPVVPMAAETKALVDRMQAFYEKTQDFTAPFEQKYTYVSFGRSQTSTGEVTFKKPGYMRWDYKTPSAKVFVLAQDRVLMLDPDALTLTKTKIGADQLSASVTFLFGRGHLADEFHIRTEPCATCRGPLLLMTPRKPDSRFQHITLEVDPKTAQVLVSTVTDPDGSTNRIEFKALKTNVGVAESHFKLQLPPGTQVMDLTGEH